MLVIRVAGSFLALTTGKKKYCWLKGTFLLQVKGKERQYSGHADLIPGTAYDFPSPEHRDKNKQASLKLNQEWLK